MTDERQNLKIEIAMLRGTLYLAARALRGYLDAPHFEIDDDGRPMMEVIVPEAVRIKAAEAIEKAERMLQEPERGRGR